MYRVSIELGADHLTLDGGGRGWLISGQQDFFILQHGGHQIFFPS